MVLRRQPHPTALRLERRLLEPGRQYLQAGLAGKVAVVTGAGARGHPHDLRTDPLGVADLSYQVFEGGAVRAVFKTLRVPPGVDPLETVIVETRLQVPEPGRFHAGKETRLERNAVSSQSHCEREEVFHRHGLGRNGLSLVHLAEKPMKTVAVDPYLHDPGPRAGRLETSSASRDIGLVIPAGSSEYQ